MRTTSAIAQSECGSEVALFGSLQSARSVLRRNGGDKLSHLWNSGDCCRKNFVLGHN